MSSGSETNVSLPEIKLNKDLDCGSVRLEIGNWSELTFVIAHFTAFSKTCLSIDCKQCAVGAKTVSNSYDKHAHKGQTGTTGTKLD